MVFERHKSVAIATFDLGMRMLPGATAILPMGKRIPCQILIGLRR